jgi:hypothetical protein
VNDLCSDPALLSLAMLEEFAAEFKRDAVSLKSVRRSLMEDSRKVGQHLILKTHAYKPTGVALGCPLPYPDAQSQFSSLCDRTEEFLRRLCNVRGPVLVRVPPLCYHITLVNRTHFDTRQDKRQVRCLSLSEKRQVEQIIRDQDCGSVTVQYRGLLTSRGGRLLVPAYPSDARVFQLKEALRDGVCKGKIRRAAFAENYPVHTATKLGHIAVELDGARLRAFLRWMQEEGAKIDLSVTFSDSYTQLGRIPL